MCIAEKTAPETAEEEEQKDISDKKNKRNCVCGQGQRMEQQEMAHTGHT